MGKDDAFEAIQPQAESQLLRVDIRREIDQHIVAQQRAGAHAQALSALPHRAQADGAGAKRGGHALRRTGSQILILHGQSNLLSLRVIP